MSTQHRIEAESHKDPDTLEREIEAKRREISGIVDELEHKLSPGELFDRALGFIRGNGGEFFGNLGQTVRANPVPVLLTSVGLIWLASSQRHPAPPRTGGLYRTDPASKVGDLADGLRERAAHARDSVHDASDRLREATHRLGERGHQAADAVRHSAHNARQGFEHLLDEQPLAVAAIGIAAGALFAAMLPPTEREDRLLGPAAERTRRRATELAEGGLQKTREKLGEHQRDHDDASPAMPRYSYSSGSNGRSDQLQ